MVFSTKLPSRLYCAKYVFYRCLKKFMRVMNLDYKHTIVFYQNVVSQEYVLLLSLHENKQYGETVARIAYVINGGDGRKLSKIVVTFEKETERMSDIVNLATGLLPCLPAVNTHSYVLEIVE